MRSAKILSFLLALTLSIGSSFAQGHLPNGAAIDDYLATVVRDGDDVFAAPPSSRCVVGMGAEEAGMNPEFAARCDRQALARDQVGDDATNR